MPESRFTVRAPSASALIWRIRATTVSLQAARLVVLLRKANFDPNQPRAPRGQPDGGQWIHVPGWSSERPRQTPRPTLVSDEGDKPPKVPSRRPLRARERNVFIKSVARWLYRGVRIGARTSPLGRASMRMMPDYGFTTTGLTSLRIWTSRKRSANYSGPYPRRERGTMFIMSSNGLRQWRTAFHHLWSMDPRIWCAFQG